MHIECECFSNQSKLYLTQILCSVCSFLLWLGLAVFLLFAVRFLNRRNKFDSAENTKVSVSQFENNFMTSKTNIFKGYEQNLEEGSFELDNLESVLSIKEKTEKSDFSTENKVLTSDFSNLSLNSYIQTAIDDSFKSSLTPRQEFFKDLMVAADIAEKRRTIFYTFDENDKEFNNTVPRNIKTNVVKKSSSTPCVNLMESMNK